MTGSRWRILSHRTVTGLQVIDGTMKCALTNHIYSWENKYTLYESGAKETLSFINTTQADCAANKASFHLQQQHRVHLFQGTKFRLHPPYVSSR